MSAPARALATTLFASLLSVGCPEPTATDDAAVAPDAVGSEDAPRTPDAHVAQDAPRSPDAGGPACVGDGCDIVEVALAYETSCARRANGEVWCWGRGQSGELGDGASRHLPGCTRTGGMERIDCSDSAVEVALPVPAIGLYTQGGFDVCAEVAGGEFYCWGARGYLITGAPTGDRLRPEQNPTLSGARSLAHNYISSCWLDASGTPSCVGDNSTGQLAQGDFLQRLSPVRPRVEAETAPLSGLVEIASSTTFGGTVCARTSAELYCWGRNDIGQLGDPANHTTCIEDIDEFDCSPWVVPVPFDHAADITRISMGSQHTCALLDGGTLWCWGQNRNGELGLGTVDAQDVTARQAPVEVTNLTGVAQVELGARHSCARRTDGTVWCWGSNDLGQLGDGVPDHSEAQCMNGATLIDCSSVPVQVVGITDAMDLDVGRHHSCVVRTSGTVWCWGYNETYSVGPGTRQPVFAPQQVNL